MCIKYIDRLWNDKNMFVMLFHAVIIIYNIFRFTLYYIYIYICGAVLYEIRICEFNIVHKRFFMNYINMT